MLNYVREARERAIVGKIVADGAVTMRSMNAVQERAEYQVLQSVDVAIIVSVRNRVLWPTMATTEVANDAASQAVGAILPDDPADQ